ncbi:unnamed protein product [Lymnaea stagnalis]|uniref:Protein SERAC1 n=1 Tax=Lymnaea stagnalis TaxID=6523 RepID=A0AAV2H006_LYMST
MHGSTTFPILKCCLRWSFTGPRPLLLQFRRKQFLGSIAFSTTPSKLSSRKQVFKYGFITLTAIGSGIALVLNNGKTTVLQRKGSIEIKRDLQDSVPFKKEEDFMFVGQDDWQLYSMETPDNEISSRIQVFVFELFNVKKFWDWLFPWEQSKSDDPWTLLELTKSSNFWIRQMGVASLACKSSWPDYKYRVVAQACDPRTLVALARYPQASDYYFLPPPKLHRLKNDVLSELKSQVLQLPIPPSPNSCLMYYRFLALDQEIRYHNDPMGMDILAHIYPLPEDEGRKEKEIGMCLDTILAYTSSADYAPCFIYNHGLAVLQHLCEDFPESSWVQMYVASILTNLSCIPELVDFIVRTGWVTILRKWSGSTNTSLSLQALTALANMDRDWMTKDLYQDIVLLHPTQRNSQPVHADIVLVHGLRGGAVKTWRQRDGIDPFGSVCWPRDWLATDFPNIRVVSIGYNSELHKWGDHCPYEQDKRTIEGRSKELMKKLQLAGVGSRPIIWIGHSMGGLIIKNIISLGENESQYSKFSSQTRGVLFFSVPHHGSSVVDVMMYAKYLLFPSVEVQELHTSSPKLAALHETFVKFMSKNSIPCLSFGENAKTPFSRPLPKVLVVPLNSSDPGIGNFVSVPHNHIDICKPCNEDDIIYQLTNRFIKNILYSIR